MGLLMLDIEVDAALVQQSREAFESLNLSAGTIELLDGLWLIGQDTGDYALFERIAAQA